LKIRKFVLAIGHGASAAPTFVGNSMGQFVAELMGRPVTLFSGRWGYLSSCPPEGYVLVKQFAAPFANEHTWFAESDQAKRELQRLGSVFGAGVEGHHIDLTPPGSEKGSLAWVMTAQQYAEWVRTPLRQEETN
jgi:hypothetical protein